jgi:hypothetical protein
LGEFSFIGSPIDYFGQILKKFQMLPTIWDSFFRGQGCALFFDKNALGYILVDFFTNSSGHPGLYQLLSPFCWFSAAAALHLCRSIHFVAKP